MTNKNYRKWLKVLNEKVFTKPKVMFTARYLKEQLAIAGDRISNNEIQNFFKWARKRNILGRPQKLKNRNIYKKNSDFQYYLNLHKK